MRLEPAFVPGILTGFSQAFSFTVSSAHNSFPPHDSWVGRRGRGMNMDGDGNQRLQKWTAGGTHHQGRNPLGSDVARSLFSDQYEASRTCGESVHAHEASWACDRGESEPDACATTHGCRETQVSAVALPHRELLPPLRRWPRARAKP